MSLIDNYTDIIIENRENEKYMCTICNKEIINHLNPELLSDRDNIYSHMYNHICINDEFCYDDYINNQNLPNININNVFFQFNNYINNINNIDNDNESIDSIGSYDDIGDDVYACQNCTRIFSSERDLNHHFIRHHSNYDELLNLDNEIDKNKINTKFPGYNKLVHDKVIEFKNNKHDDCSICCMKYSHIHSRPKLLQKIDDKCYDKCYVDSEDKKKTNHKNYPVKLKCCNNHMCHCCIKQLYDTNGYIKCPFCRVEHK
jgi:hypothetical protein